MKEGVPLHLFFGEKVFGDKGGADAADANTVTQSDGSDSADSIPTDGIAVPQGDDPYEEPETREDIRVPVL